VSAGLNALVDFRFYPVGKFSATSTCPGAGNDKGCEMDMLEACVVQHTCPYGSGPCEVGAQLSLINWLACFEGGSHAAGVAAARSCAATAGLASMSAALACYADGAQKQAAFAAVEAAAVATGEQPYTCFPWVAVNGTVVSDPKVDSCLAKGFDLEKAICGAIEGPKPAACM